MIYEILNNNYDKPLIDRLLDIRGIKDKEQFLNPSYQNSWYDPFLLSWMEKSLDKILKTIKNNERIVVFWDYDVDWVTATYVVFYFLHNFLKYKNISIRLPSRSDGYGIRWFHIDELKEKDVKLVITVDNGITAIEEIDYAKKIWIDIIVTDHHIPLEHIPSPYSLINPKLSEKYPFKELSGVWVAFKLVCALASKLNISKEKKQKMMNYFLPIVAIWTVADCVMLIDENRLLAKKWLEIINNKKKRPPNIDNMINYLNLKNIDSYHIGFVIWPRLNASWRMYKPDDSFQALYQHNKSFQKSYLEKLENMNIKRKSTQDDIIKEVEAKIDLSKNIIVANWYFHEWIIGIVAWKITEKYNKPSIIIHIDKEKKEAIWSCRAPMHFSIVDMLDTIWSKYNLFERYGWHAQAWWFTCKLDNLDKVVETVYKYWKNILSENIKKINFIDTKITEKDLMQDIKDVFLLAPFGEKNKEPIFLIENVNIKKINIVWKEKNHIKIYGQLGQIDINLLKWSWLSFLDNLKWKDKMSAIVTIEKDDFNWWYFFKIIDILE